MDVISHDHKSIYRQSFIEDAIFQVFNYDVPVALSAENIYPAYYSESEKMRCILIPDFVSACKLIVHLFLFVKEKMSADGYKRIRRYLNEVNTKLSCCQEATT